MSHFKLIVAGDYKTLLIPFDENNTTLYKFIDQEDEFLREYLEEKNSKGEKYTEIYSTFEDFMDNWYGEKRDPKTNRYGCYRNPNTKYDYYIEGGRYTGTFGVQNQVKISNFRFIEDLDCFALLTHRGEWHEKGEMHWFGQSTKTDKSSKLFKENMHAYLKSLAELKPDLLITVIDCHI